MTQSNAEPTMQTYTLDPDYHWDILSFSVGLTRFRMRADRFVAGSDYFVEKYEIKKILAEGAEICIELDVQLEDFKAFLKALEPVDRDGKVDLDKEGWISVLKVATHWLFNDLRQLAISTLNSMDLEPVERVCLAKQYNVSAWLLSAYEALITTREDAITIEEATKMDEAKETALRLYSIAFSFLKGFSRGVTPPSLSSQIERVFCDELAKVRLVERDHLTKAEKALMEQERLREEECSIEAREEEERRCALEEEMLRFEAEEQALKAHQKEIEAKRIALQYGHAIRPARPASPLSGESDLDSDFSLQSTSHKRDTVAEGIWPERRVVDCSLPSAVPVSRLGKGFASASNYNEVPAILTQVVPLSSKKSKKKTKR